MSLMDFDGTTDVTVVIKAAPEFGRTHGETVCVAGIDANGNWHRLYPVPFKDLSEEQTFDRWDVIRVRWRRSANDERPESKRIDPQTLRKVGKASRGELPFLVQRALVENLEEENAAGRSLALIRPTNTRFFMTRLSDKELSKSQRRRDEIRGQTDLFSVDELPKKAPPYSFNFEFDHGGRRRTHKCIDWETEQTFFSWRRKYGEDYAVREMTKVWNEFEAKGVVFAMGTHRVKMWNVWLLSGILRVKPPQQGQLLL